MTVPPLPEGFRAIAGFEFYCINAVGEVMGCRKAAGAATRVIHWKLRKSYQSKTGHTLITLSKNRKCYSRWIHRLVLETFRGPCPDGMEACHNDGNPRNNDLSNLRWDTHKANIGDKAMHGTVLFGVRNNNVKLTEDSVKSIRRLYRQGGIGRRPLAKMFGVTKRCIQQICNRETWIGVPD